MFEAIAHRERNSYIGVATAALICIFSFALLEMGLLNFPLVGDEIHFWNTSQWLFDNGLPSAQQLRTYNELNTPLPFLIFGGADHFLHVGFAGGRAINLVASLGTLAVILGIGGIKRASFLAAIGLLLCPYFAYVGVLLYTDSIPIFLATVGVYFATSDRRTASAICFVLGIACRQYIVAFPVALLACGYVKSLRAGGPWCGNISNWVPVLSLFGWVLFFGGPGPSPAIVSQTIHAGKLYPDHGIYFLATIGAYYVAVEAILFRRIGCRLQLFRIFVVAILLLTFLVYPPVGNFAGVDTMGYLDRALRIFMPERLRILTLLVLAIITCLRFDPLSLPGLIVYANATLLMLAHVAWDKYALPALAVLWMLKSAGAVRDVGESQCGQPSHEAYDRPPI